MGGIADAEGDEPFASRVVAGGANVHPGQAEFTVVVLGEFEVVLFTVEVKLVQWPVKAVAVAFHIVSIVRCLLRALLPRLGQPGSVGNPIVFAELADAHRFKRSGDILSLPVGIPGLVYLFSSNQLFHSLDAIRPVFDLQFALGNNPVEVFALDDARALAIGQILFDILIVGIRVFDDVGHPLLHLLEQRFQEPAHIRGL